MTGQEEMADDLSAARGIVFGFMLCVPAWAAFGAMCWWLS